MDIHKFGDVAPSLRRSAMAAASNNYKSFTFDCRAEFGVELSGAGKVMNIFLGAESLQDDGSRPVPVNSNYVYAGFRFVGKNIGL